MILPTELQKKTYELRAKRIKNKKPIKMGEIILEAGGSKHTARKPYQITQSKGWQQILAQYDDEPIMQAIYKDALDGKDKRNATKNRELYLRVKDRFPQKESQLVGLFKDV